MTDETHYVLLDADRVTGIGYTPDGTLPDGAMACSAAEAEAAGPWTRLVDGKLVIGAPASTVEAPEVAARRIRDAALARTDWLVIRHRDQQDAASPTTLSAARYAELLAWRQELRDFPAEGSFPDAPPRMPAWLDAG